MIVVLNKRKPAARKNRIVLLNASRHFRKGRPKNYLPEEDIRSLAALYLKGEPVGGWGAVITTEQAREADYNLSPGRWVAQGGDANHRTIKEIVADVLALDAQARVIDENLARLLARL